MATIPTKKKKQKILKIKHEFEKLAAAGCQEAIDLLAPYPDYSSCNDNSWQFYAD